MTDTENTPTPEVAPEAVETQSEQVVDTETSTDTPADATVDTANGDWETRYKELQSKFTKTSQEKAELERMVNQPVAEEYQPAPEASDNPFDEATTSGVLTLAEQAAEKAWDKREAIKWVKTNADDLKNPIVDSRTKDLIKQGYDRDDALVQAKKELSSQVNPATKEALAQGVKEGQQLANDKDRMGAVGTVSNLKIDPDNLSAEEFAKYHGIPRN